VEDLQGLLDLDYLPRIPRNKAIGIGCIGAGFVMADCHLVAYRKAGFDPVAIASLRPAHAGEVAARHGIPRVYDDYRELLDVLFGDPERVYASVRPDPRTRFAHQDGICLYIMDYDSGLRAAAWDDIWAGPAREGSESDIYIRLHDQAPAGFLVMPSLEGGLVPGCFRRDDGSASLRVGRAA
jgi:predicted dehydrogenase